MNAEGYLEYREPENAPKRSQDLEPTYHQHLHFGDGSLPIGEIVSRLPSDARVSIETKRDSSDNLDDFERDAAFLCALDG